MPKPTFAWLPGDDMAYPQRKRDWPAIKRCGLPEIVVVASYASYLNGLENATRLKGIDIDPATGTVADIPAVVLGHGVC